MPMRSHASRSTARTAEMSDAIRAPSAPRPVGSYPHARRVGNLLFLSGIGRRDHDTNAIVGNVHDADGRLLSYDHDAPARAGFANVRALLDARPEERRGG